MRKIPAVFVYDPATLASGPNRPKGGARYSEIVTPGCEWVLAGEGRATEKIDGTACLVDDRRLFKRYDAKGGKTPPPSFVPAQPEPDPVTGHWPGWVPVGDEPESKWHLAAWKALIAEPLDGTLELVGPHFQSNPYGLENDVFVAHGSAFMLEGDPLIARDYALMKDYFAEVTGIEGVVFHHPDGRMAKVTRVGFGFQWPMKEAAR